MRHLKTQLAGFFACLLFAGIGHAVPMIYTDSAAFFTNLSTAGLTPSTLDFDGLSSGDIIADGNTIDGITFNYDFGGVQMMVSDIYDTTSPTNFLGTDDEDIFQDGDDFNLSFAPSNAIGMFFLTADEMFDGDILLRAGGETASLLASDLQQILSDDSYVYFLGIIDDAATFTSADIDTGQTLGESFFLYNVDDITTAAVSVPEPGTLVLFGLGLLALSVRRILLSA